MRLQEGVHVVWRSAHMDGPPELLSGREASPHLLLLDDLPGDGQVGQAEQPDEPCGPVMQLHAQAQPWTPTATPAPVRCHTAAARWQLAARD